ncbi:MAG: hypothetical protein IPP72_08380 [Chitinophagaceae bacterium]|nr:hypothetical protein [Chitinophagaceae bacterium]
MYSKTFILLLSIFFLSCNAKSSTSTDISSKATPPSTKTGDNPYPFIAGIPLPDGYKRTVVGSNSFSNWLGKVPLKKDRTVYLFNGDKKENQSAQFAVLDISTGDKNLQQCADAVMRLRAEYLFASGQYSNILFTDNEGGNYQFTQPYNKEHLMNYLQKVFGMCGSASLSKQLKHVNLIGIKPGDVLIRGGFPGHAVMVMDVAVNKEGRKIYLLAQSYMPAQDIHVLVNPSDENLSPWYEADDAEKIITPEFVFTRNELKQW